MNFPDLETCRAIAGEFEGSEFVYVTRRDRDKIIPRKELEYDEIHRGWYQKGTPLDWRIEAPAPTCEELGDWLFWESPKYIKELKKHRLIKFNAYLYQLDQETQGGWHEVTKIKAPNETQARATAVKKIIEHSTPK